MHPLCASLAKSVFIGVYPWLNPCFLVQFTAHSQSKSTAGHPKSTVDLRCELLICVESGLQTPLLPGYRHSFGSITTRELWDTGQMQTDAGQKDELRPHCSLDEKAGAERRNKINYPPLIYG
jgi:hypothetical protein